MAKNIRLFFFILLCSLLPTLLIWLPFYLRLPQFWNIPLPAQGMATIVANYDGPLYIIVAKTLYNPLLIKDNFSFNLPVEYYAAHFPLYPLLIRLASQLIGYPYAMLAITALSSLLAIYYFHRLISLYASRNNALWLTFAFSVFPARWLIVRSIGSPEPLFLAATIASVFYFSKKHYWPAAFWGVIAQLTKSPGIILFIAFLGAILFPKLKRLAAANINKLGQSLLRKTYPILLIPASLVGLFFFYQKAFGDLFAYFHSGDNIHLFFPPFQVFNYSAPWVDTHWLEEIIFIYFIGILGLLRLIQQKNTLFTWFVGLFFASTLFVSHRDLLRYSLPIVPFLYVAFADFLVKKEFKIALFAIVIPIYLFSLAFLSGNVMPISNWSPFL